MVDYEEMMLQISDVMRKANKVRPTLTHEEAVKAIRSIVSQNSEWIPVKIRELTEEEKEEYPDYTFMYDCNLPEDGEEVLITTLSGEVVLDTFYCDDGCYFETYCDAEDVIAWMPLPEPYERGDV